MKPPRFISLLLAASVGLAAGALLAATPPATPKRPVSDTYHGVTVVDLYRWLENWDDPEVKAWSEAQNTAARGLLNALPQVDAIRARVTEIMSVPTFSHGSLHFAGGQFALKRQPPKQLTPPRPNPLKIQFPASNN
jgi:prolyl oligopeptidase